MICRLIGLGLVLAAVSTVRAEDRLVVHEWGTFTALQDESGSAIGGINTDDEPVPQFVHNAAGLLLLPPTEAPLAFFDKGTPRCHPDVTMRLETPVIYFHAGSQVQTVDLVVQFFGGWLTQYFPDATAAAPGMIQENKFGPLTHSSASSLVWSRLTLNGGGAAPASDARVWTAPRQVDASIIRTRNGESEKFLFYRGVGHIDAPVRVVRSGGEFVVSANAAENAKRELENVRDLWLADIRADGTTAYRVLHPFENTTAFVVKTAASFQPQEYAKDSTTALRKALRDALTKAGLFEDEADALLNTWEVSYFKSPGLRLFFLVPSSWTDRKLHIDIAQPADLTRVMVGRIELVTPAQRGLLASIAANAATESLADFRSRIVAKLAPAGDPNAQAWLWNDLLSGRKTLASFGFNAPKYYQNYLDLGRFRNALLLEEQKQRPTPELDEFIKRFGLEGYKY